MRTVGEDMPEAESDLSPPAAAQRILKIQSFDAALRRRVRGVSWMVWSLAVPGIFLTFSAAAAVWGTEGDWPLWGFLLWLPWALVGLGATVQLWRSAGLLAPVEPKRLAVRVSWIGLAFVGAIYAAFTLTHVILGGLDKHAPSPAIVVLVAVGMGCLAWGLLPSRLERSDRAAFLLTGLFLLVTDAIALLAIRDQPPSSVALLFGWLAPLSTGLAFSTAGWTLATRM